MLLYPTGGILSPLSTDIEAQRNEGKNVRSDLDVGCTYSLISRGAEHQLLSWMEAGAAHHF